LEFQHVALIDDVITTGHTVAELTSQLIHSGVARIDVWALARTVTPSIRYQDELPRVRSVQ
jgi:predicted amidophosphoribosyltransferase